MKTRTHLLIGFICVTLLVTSCSKTDQQVQPADTYGNENFDKSIQNYQTHSYPNRVPVSWFIMVDKLIKETPGFAPPVAARAIGYTGVTLYQSVVVGMPGHMSLEGQLAGLSNLPIVKDARLYNLNVSANAALARIVKDLFPTATPANLNSIDSLEAANYPTDKIQIDVLRRSKEYGRATADAIFEWSKTDGGHEAYLNLYPLDYIPPIGPGLWIPTSLSPAMLPYWGSNRAFIAADASSSVDPPPPPPFSTTPGDSFYRSANEIYQIGKNLTPRQTTIAQYWSDGTGTFTPPGHLIGITNQIIRNEGLKLDDAAIIFGQAGVGLYDASIVCWRCKYQYNVLRPETFINLYIDPNWVPLIGSPPFPSYTSGHATFSSTVAQVLENHFGTRYAFTDSTQIAFGFSPRSFNSFQDAANEATISRIFGGIHFDFDGQSGLMCGELLSNNVLSLQW